MGRGGDHMSATGEFKYVNGWYTIFTGNKGLVERHGPFETEELAKKERDKRTGVKNES